MYLYVNERKYEKLKKKFGANKYSYFVKIFLELYSKFNY